MLTSSASSQQAEKSVPIQLNQTSPRWEPNERKLCRGKIFDSYFNAELRFFKNKTSSIFVSYLKFTELLLLKEIPPLRDRVLIWSIGNLTCSPSLIQQTKSVKAGTLDLTLRSSPCLHSALVTKKQSSFKKNRLALKQAVEAASQQQTH